ncbi:MAG TPA: hypothetical protein VJS64_20495 [Pyrinomonadaceae bacterium]|nr:hypothetical protein [Pyrinomonadaceae bacterium]
MTTQTVSRDIVADPSKGGNMRRLSFIVALLILLAGVSVQAQKGVPPIEKEGEYDICVQDDVNGYYLLFNSTTGDYEFERCSDGVEFLGKGQISGKECDIILEDAGFNRYIFAAVNLCEQTGKAHIRVFKGLKTTPYIPPMLETLTDSNMIDDTWDCSTVKK